MGNLIANRTLILLYVCAALQIWWLLEQPKGSLMQELPSFRMFMKQVRMYRHYMCMEHYGGATQKPTWLYSGIHDCVEQLQSFFVSPYFVEAHIMIFIVLGFHSIRKGYHNFTFSFNFTVDATLQFSRSIPLSQKTTVQLGLKAVHIQNQYTFRTNQESLYIYIHEYLQAQPKRGIPFLKIWFDPIPFRYDLSFSWQEISYYIVGVPLHVRPIRKEGD